MNSLYPYIRYAQALLMIQKGYSSISSIDVEDIISEIEYGLNTFRLEPAESYFGKETVKYHHTRKAKGNPDEGLFLAPSVLTTDRGALNTWDGANKILRELEQYKENRKEKNQNASISLIPLSGEYLSFATTAKIGRGKSKVSLKEVGFATITTLTKDKPAFQSHGDNYCLIPDLELSGMMDFIKLFRKMTSQKNINDIYIGNVSKTETGKGEMKSVKYKPNRPFIYRGNFPNAPKSTLLGNIGIISAIGELTKDEQTSALAKSVLEDLKGTTIYQIQVGDATPYSINHHVIDLAKSGRLRAIIDSMFYTKLYSQDRRSYSNTEYQKFDLMTSRFLQLFNEPAFKDFLAFRAEYPETTEILFNTYFRKVDMIEPEIIKSAREYGKWLNQVAYFAAKNEIGDKGGEQLREVKAKALIEIESSAFSAKDGASLIAQTNTRAGRLTGSDAPEAAGLFLEKAASGELTLDKAKNLIIAFSRLRNVPTKSPENDNAEQAIENETPKFIDN